jgi:hypothetical protein
MPVIAVVGSRTWIYQDRVWEYLDKLHARGQEMLLVSGACPEGPDLFAELWAKKRGNPILLYPADWSKGRSAGFARNSLIIKDAEIVLAFWDGRSKGTLDSIEKGWKLGKQVLVATPGTPVTRVTNHEDLARKLEGSNTQ